MTPTTLVVVPVYGDLESLLRCVDGLVEHLDTDRHRVLLVNDCGPDADTIERALLDRTAGLPGFRYERNDHNLGFVGTCNRAVTELDTGSGTTRTKPSSSSTATPSRRPGSSTPCSPSSTRTAPASSPPAATTPRSRASPTA